MKVKDPFKTSSKRNLLHCECDRLHCECNGRFINVRLTQKPSQTLISPCRASCFSQGETLREQVGEPARAHWQLFASAVPFSFGDALAFGKPLRVYVIP